jgi:hypothetical protein
VLRPLPQIPRSEVDLLIARPEEAPYYGSISYSLLLTADIRQALPFYDQAARALQSGRASSASITICVELLAIAFCDTITRGQLTEAERVGIENPALGPVDSATDFASAVRAFFFNCRVQRSLNKISEDHYLYAVTEVVGALRGLDADERSIRRILPALDPAFIPTWR